MRIMVCLLVLALVLPSCAGGGLKASTIKPYTDQLAVAIPVLVDEAIPLIEDPEKRARFEKYGKIAKAAALAIKAAVDLAAAGEKQQK